MKEALFYKKLDNKLTQCFLCPHNCKIATNNLGFCKVRKNIDGILYSITYEKISSIAIDPMEKKPLYHFYPGEKILSIGTIGCNLNCQFCQNFEISKEFNENYLEAVTIDDIIKICLEKNIKNLAFTYNEPIVSAEFVIDTFKKATKHHLKCVLVTNGFINKECINQVFENVDACNIDLKSFSPDFYKKICNGDLNKVLEAIKYIKEKNIFIELTNLIIPELNDNEKEINQLTLWIKNNLGSDTPIHFSAFHPQYKMLNKQATPLETLLKAYEIAKNNGLNYVYIGNTSSERHSSTYCFNCNSLLIKRNIYNIEAINLNKKDKTCLKCNTKINITT